MHDIAYYPMTIDMFASGTLHISASRNQAAEMRGKDTAERSGGIHLIVYLQHGKKPINAAIPSVPQAASSPGINDTSYNPESNVQVQVSNSI